MRILMGRVGGGELGCESECYGMMRMGGGVWGCRLEIERWARSG